MKELEMLDKRQFDKKSTFTFSDFCVQVFKLFGGNIHMMSFADISQDIRELYGHLHSIHHVQAGINVKAIKQKSFE